MKKGTKDKKKGFLLLPKVKAVALAHAKILAKKIYYFFVKICWYFCRIGLFEG